LERLKISKIASHTTQASIQNPKFKIQNCKRVSCLTTRFPSKLRLLSYPGQTTTEIKMAKNVASLPFVFKHVALMPDVGFAESKDDFF
jgi:hypothetical protein